MIPKLRAMPLGGHLLCAVREECFSFLLSNCPLIRMWMLIHRIRIRASSSVPFEKKGYLSIMIYLSKEKRKGSRLAHLI